MILQKSLQHHMAFSQCVPTTLQSSWLLGERSKETLSRLGTAAPGWAWAVPGPEACTGEEFQVMLRDTSGCHLLPCMYPTSILKLSWDGDVHPSLQGASAPAAAQPQPSPGRVTPSWAPARDTNPTTRSQRTLQPGKNDVWRDSQQPERCGQGDPSGAGSDWLWMRSRAQNINIGADNDGDGDAWEGEDGSPAISGHYCSSCNASPGKNGMDTSCQCIYLKSPNFY